MGEATAEPILLVEDTQSLSMIYENVLNRAGLSVTCAFTVSDAMEAYRQTSHRVILLDLMLPDGDGLDLLRHICESNSVAKVIVITANGSILRAVEAMREGAFDFLVKPFDDRKLMTAVTNAIKSIQMEASDPAEDPRVDSVKGPLGHFIGSSPQMQQIYGMIRSIGKSTSTVFVTGESGTGKEVCAESIHAISTRRHGPFIPLNCGAIPNALLESEVFGHLKGSFTGAITDKLGAAAAADGGTLFLDEICEMDLSLQTKLLRFLQTSTVQPVGATRPEKVDVRIICATNRDPAAEVRAGRFREDLFYRLHVVPIVLPPLRDRENDVIEIAERLLHQFSLEEGKAFRTLASETKELLVRHTWPGNVRELQNVLRNAVVLHEGTTITPTMLRATVQMADNPVEQGASVNDIAPSASPDQIMDEALSHLVGMPLEMLERSFIEKTIASCGGSIPRAARLLELSPSTLYRKRENWDRK